MVGAALLFLAALLLVQQLPSLPSPIFWVYGGFLAAIMAGLRYWRGLVFVLAVLYGLLFAHYRLTDPLQSSLEGIDIAVKGIITDLPEHDEKHLRFNFKVTESPQPLPQKIRLSWYYPDQTVKTGQLWAFTVKLKRPHGSLNPSGFDFEGWLFSHGMGATGYIRPYPKPHCLAEDAVANPLASLRQTVADRLTAALSGKPYAGLIKALAIGDGSGISQAQWEVFRKTGTVHLVVISGSHIAFIAGWVYVLVRILWARTGILSWSPQTIAALAAIFAGIVYAGLAGFTIPTQRAAIMLTVVMLVRIWQRHLQAANLLAIALLAVLVVDPLAVLDRGFWLSFLSVALMVYCLAGRLGNAGYWSMMLKINWVTALGLAPLLLVFFQQVSLVSPLANAVAVPLISLVFVPIALLATLLLWISLDWAMLLFALLDFSLQGLYSGLQQLAEWPYATLNYPKPPVWTLAFALPGMVWLLAPRGIPARWLGGVMLMPLLFPATTKPANGEMTVTLLDVGQGLAVAVQTAQHCLVYDAGAKFSPDSDSGRNVLVPFLRSQGVARLDGLVISHGDNDHIGGAASLLAEIPTARLLTSVPERLAAFHPQRCQAGQRWQWDGVEFTILSPADNSRFASENDNSCVLKIRSEYGSVLLTGDIQADAEQWLVKNAANLQADILVAPHHGSKSSSTADFLAAVQAKTVLIPAGYRNPFGHPHPDVLARYRRYQADWLNTADSGAITVQIKQGNVIINAYRATDGNYWHSQPPNLTD
ncbi:DNA internalization-related competence protein ComEC/Rec2 [Methylosoma difficile]